MKIFPVPYDKGDKWVSYLELNETGITGADSTYMRNALPAYMYSLNEARKTGSYKAADQFIDGLSSFQKKYGGKILPSEDKINSEILYNKYDIFKKLYYLYMMAGVFMLMFTVIKIFNNSKKINIAVKLFHFLIALFLYFTLPD